MARHHHTAQPFPPGRVSSSCILYGGMGMVLAVALQWLGMFKLGDVWLRQFLASVLVDSQLFVAPVSVTYAVATVFAFGIAFAVLDSPATWRRIVLGLSGFVLLLATVPVCALWHVYFSPFPVVIAYFWAWFCSMMYVSQHRMPCEAAMVGHAPQSGEVLPRQKNAGAVPGISASNTAAGEDDVDPNAKYQPKEQQANG
ncbi:MAG: hypothetical protein ACPIG6_07115 [Akkermansiaceae bacterium]